MKVRLDAIICCLGALLLVACQTTGGRLSSGQYIQPSGLNPVYPREASCPQVRSPFASWYGINGPEAGRRSEIHNGIDIPSPIGTPVRAIANGRVKSVTAEYNPGPDGRGSVYVGETIRITHFQTNDQGIMDSNNPYPLGTLFDGHYSHLQKEGIVKEGHLVKPGDIIGYVGHHWVGDHLHLGISVLYKEQDPIKAFTGSLVNEPTNKNVAISYIDQNGRKHPQDAKVVWPIACVLKVD